MKYSTLKHLLFFLILPATLLAQQSSHSKSALANKKQLDGIIRAYYDVYDQLFPVLSESKLYTEQLENYISQPHRDAQKKLYESTLQRLATIDKNKLPEPSLYEYETLELVLKSRLNHLRYEWYLLPESSFGPNMVLGDFIKQGGGNRYVTFASVKDYDDFLKRIDIFTNTVCDTVIHYMRLGVKKNIVQPKRMMELVVENLEPVVKNDIEKNPFYEPILKMPDSFPLADQQRLKALYQEAIQKKLKPAYAKAIHFIKTEYIPACRETVGIWAYPWGKAAYQEKLNDYYGGLLPPDTLLTKAKRIDAQYGQELKLLLKKRKFSGSADAFFKTLPTDAFRIFKTKQEVIDRFYALLRQVNDSIPKYFSLTPKSKLEVLEEPNSNGSGGARFTSGSEDGSRPDRIYLNFTDPAKVNYTVLPIGVLHEGDPGHPFFSYQYQKHKSAFNLVDQ